MSSAGRVAGRVAFVTGAARGIGRACAARLAEEGADVALLDLGGAVETVPYPGATPENLESARTEIEALGRKAITIRADVRDGRSMAAATARTVEELGSLDILVAAAGIDSWGVAWELTDEQWQTMIDVNLTGVWQAAKAAAPYMVARRAGSMVFIGSVLSHRANETYAHYTVAKHGVLGLVKAMGLELAPHMVRVNAVAPTAVSSPMFMNPEFLDHMAGKDGAGTDDVQEFLLRWNAMPQPWIEPVDVANAVLFLASDEARTITGVSLPVDLGAMLK